MEETAKKVDDIIDETYEEGYKNGYKDGISDTLHYWYSKQAGNLMKVVLEVISAIGIGFAIGWFKNRNKKKD